ncbi:MAG: hypothetical protein WA921_12130 [Ahrensia sp.]
MIIGSITVDDDSVNTHRDSYLLANLSVVAVRRPFFGMAVLYGVGLGGFAASFADLLYSSELITISSAIGFITLVGWNVGQLKLLSKDLRGSELSDVIWGSYDELNRVRRQIAGAMRSVKSGGEV